MVNPVIRNGKLILVNGTLGGSLDCCCPVVTNPCVGFADCTGHTGTPGVAPSIALTIFDADYTGGSISWCSIVWTQQDIIDGVTNCVCPTHYQLQNPLTQTTLQTSVSGTNWDRWQNTPAGFIITRGILHQNVSNTSTYFYRNYMWRVNNNAAPVATNLVFREKYTYPFSAGTNTSYEIKVRDDTGNLKGLNPATTGNQATVNDYRITDLQFGNYTDTNGINWKWERGNGWE